MSTATIAATKITTVGDRRVVVTDCVCVFCKGTGAMGAVRTAGQCCACLGFGFSLADGIDAQGRPFWE